MHVCSRCHYQSDQKGHLIRHLQRKVECEGKHSQQSRLIQLKELVPEIPEEDKPFVCPCGASYKHASNLYRHKKACTYTPPPSQPDLVKLVADLQAQLLQVQKVQNNPTYINNNNTTNNNNTNNITNNIVIIKNNYGAEKYEHLYTDHPQVFQQCLLNRDISQLIAEIYCDKEHPENQTVRMRNVNRGLMEKYYEEQWQVMDQDDILTDLINKGYKVLHTYAHNNKDDVMEHCCDDEEDDYEDLLRWLKYACTQDKQLKTDKRNLIIVFIKNKTLLLGK